MKNIYVKPQIKNAYIACKRIEGSGAKTLMLATEIPNGPIVCTSPAYEADE